MESGLQDPEKDQAQDTPDTDREGYRLVQRLSKLAKDKYGPINSRFKANWDFLLGKNHWALPATAGAMLLDEWSCKSIRNWLFATVDNKNAVVSGTKPNLSMEPLDDQSTALDRLTGETILLQELRTMHWERVAEDCYLHGSANGVGIALVAMKPDPLGLPDPESDYQIPLKVTLTAINPADFYPDPDADNLDECRFVLWEPELPRSRIREMFPSLMGKIKGSGPSTTNQMGETVSEQGDKNLVYGQGTQTGDTGAQESKNRVQFVFIRDESLVEEFRKVTVKEGASGLWCGTCGLLYQKEMASTGPDGTPICPECQSPMTEKTIPAEMTDQRLVSRPYPFGRLIVTCGKAELYDGPNPDDIEEIFPFAAYHHYRVPGSFQGYGDVALLKSPQEVADVTMGQCVDYVRMAVNGPLEFPSNEPAWVELGNGPGQKIPSRRENMGLARYVTPNGFNVGAWEALDRTTWKDFQVVSGLLDVSSPGQPSAPISATESAGKQRAASSRVGTHVRRRGDFLSRIASITFQMMNQHYRKPMPVTLSLPHQTIPGASTQKTIAIELSKLPPMNVRVTCDMEEIEKDKNMGQNLAGLMTQGLVPPVMQVLLPYYGVSASDARQLLKTLELQQELGGAQGARGTAEPSPAAGTPAPPSFNQPQQSGGMNGR